MAVAFDAAAEVARTGTASPQTWVHTPVGVPRAVAVAAIHGTSATDHVTAVSYGGQALARVVRATDTATEPGAAEWWFLGANIPTGPQTVSATCGATTDDIHFVSITFTAAANCEVLDFDAVNQDATNPSVTLQYGGRTALAVGALYGGGAAPTAFTPNANCVTVHDHDLGAFYAEVIRQTNPGSADFAIGGTSAADDVAFAAMAVTEVQAQGPVDTPKTLAVAGTGAAALTRRIVAARTLGASGTGTVGRVSRLQASRTMAASGTGTAALVSGLGFRQALSVAGAGAVAAARLVARTRALQVAGAGIAGLARRVQASRTLAASGTGAVGLADGVGLVQGLAVLGTGLAGLLTLLDAAAQAGITIGTRTLSRVIGARRVGATRVGARPLHELPGTDIEEDAQ